MDLIISFACVVMPPFSSALAIPLLYGAYLSKELIIQSTTTLILD